MFASADAGLDVALDAAFGDDVSERNVADEMAVGAAAGAAGPVLGRVLQGGRNSGEVVNATVQSGTTTTTVSAPALIEEIGEAIVTETAIQTTTSTIDAITDDLEN